jgi:hypothetical protein
MRRAALFVLTLALIPSVSAFAQQMQVTAYFAPTFIGGERTFLAEPDIPVTTNYGAGWRFGFRFGRQVHERMALEGTYATGRNELNVVQAAPSVQSRSFPFSLHQFAANGLYYFLPDTSLWRPYVTAGLGITRYSPTEEARTLALSEAFLSQPTRIEADNMVHLNFGGGVDRRLADGPWSVRLDFRDYVSDQPTFGLPETPFTAGGAFFPSNGSAHNVELTAGVAFQF